MTPLPKRRHSTRRGGKRQAAIKLSLPQLTSCPSCGTRKLPHRVCPSCGAYNTKRKTPKTKSAAKAEINTTQ